MRFTNASINSLSEDMISRTSGSSRALSTLPLSIARITEVRNILSLKSFMFIQILSLKVEPSLAGYTRLGGV